VVILASPNTLAHSLKLRLVAQGAGLALNDRQIMAPVVNGLPRPIVRSLDDPPVLTYDLAFDLPPESSLILM